MVARAWGLYSLRWNDTEYKVWEVSLGKRQEGDYGAPLCKCGSRATRRVEGLLTRQCSACGETFAYRLKDGLLVPMAVETAEALDEERR